jgi:hypothetical protein
MTALYDCDTDDLFELKPLPKKKPKPKQRRCVICRASVEPDGYGSYVHSGTEDVPATYYGCQYYSDGYRIIIKPTDSRFAHVATAV